MDFLLQMLLCISFRINGNDSCTELLVDLLGKGIINLKDRKGRTALHAAAYSDQGESMQILLGHKADVNGQDNTGKTPIMYAASNGHTSAVGKSKCSE